MKLSMWDFSMETTHTHPLSNLQTFNILQDTLANMDAMHNHIHKEATSIEWLR